jgi:glucose-6-phosphate isomerase
LAEIKGARIFIFMKTIKLSIDKAFGFISEQKVAGYKAEVAAANAALHNGTGKGSDFLGWLNLPSSIDEVHLSDLENTAKILRENCEVVVVIGIGGSYLGAKAVIDALSNSFDWLLTDRKSPVVVYAGQNIGEDYLYELQELLKNKKFGIISISKSGTTTEPALAFRLLKTQLEEQQGKEASKNLIVAVTDKARGALRTLATQEGYKTYIIEDNIGGRFSVLSPVGLLPIAVAGFDIRQLVAGAVTMETKCGLGTPFEENPAAQYAAVRNELYKSGKKIEILVNFHPKLHFIGEWWKQLYGESEGKDNIGIFPASVDLTTDLHSMGQWIQEGERTIFETVISIQESNYTKIFPTSADNLDGLNFLAGKRVDEVNKMAELGTMIAHIDGGVPNLKIELPKVNEYYLGELLYFFEKACGISGYLLGVNPFDQPGVEAYKKNMFALLEKPGFEAETKAIKARL